jgi:hypothetical protein
MGIKELFERRRNRWDAEHPYFGGMETARNLRERLHTYASEIKHEESTPYMTMDEICMRMAPINREVADVWDEISERYSEEIELARHELSAEELKNARLRDVMKEIKDADEEHQMKGASTFDVDDGTGPSDSALQNKVGKELQRKIGIRPSIKVKVQRQLKETVTNPADYDPEPHTSDPSRETTGMADLQAEIEAAVRKLLPADNIIIAQHIREELANRKEELERIEACEDGNYIKIDFGALKEEK